MKRLRLILLMLGLCFAGSAHAEAPVDANKFAMKEFVRSCTYGVLAGTLVGTATLAFTDQPGEHLNRVARGASLGLYAGILLGAYVVYIVPGQLEGGGEEEAPVDAPADSGGFKFLAYPMITANGLEGFEINMRLLSF